MEGISIFSHIPIPVHAISWGIDCRAPISVEPNAPFISKKAKVVPAPNGIGAVDILLISLNHEIPLLF